MRFLRLYTSLFVYFSTITSLFITSLFLTTLPAFSQVTEYDESFWAGKEITIRSLDRDLEQGLLPSYPDNYQFSEGGNGIKYTQHSYTLSSNNSFNYQINSDGQLLISNIQLSVSFTFTSSGFYEEAERLWGLDVAEAMRRVEDILDCRVRSSQWETRYGIDNELIEIKSDDGEHLDVEVTATYVEALVVPEHVTTNPDCGWDVDARPTYTEVYAPKSLQINYSPSNNFNGLSSNDIIGSWSVPIWYAVESGEDIFFFDYPYLHQDKLVFTEEIAQAQNSGASYQWSLNEGVLTLEDDTERYEYTVISARGNYLSVSVKRFVDNELVSVQSSEMAKFTETAPSSEELNQFIQQDYPFVLGNTLGKPFKANYISGMTRCSENNSYFGFAFLTDGSVAARSRCFDFYDYDTNEISFRYGGLLPNENFSFRYEAGTRILEVLENNGNPQYRRYWQIVEILDDGDLLVMEHSVTNFDEDNDEIFEASEDWVTVQPRLQIYRKMDLSQNKEVWQNTDSDGDGLNNAEEDQYGTDIINSDTDADGVADFTDAWPLDSAASLDTDSDGYPDSWNAGYSAADSSTGLVLDEFPNNSQRWTTVDTDGDGVTDDTETLLSLNINDASDVWQDDDGDRLPLLLERQEATNDSNRDNDVFSESRLLVQQAFVDMAGRFATDTEVNDGLTQLSGASSPLDIYVASLDDSSLARLGLVGRIYQALLNRSPDQGGLNFFRRQLQSGGMNNDQIVSGFINSTEFQSRYGNLSNSEFVELVYQNVLGRSPDPAGLAYWEEQLTSGNTNPTGLMLGFITSQEFIDREDVAQRLNGLSLVMTNRTLSQDDMTRYRQWVESEGNYRSVIRELLSSQGYREQLLAGVSDATADSDADGRPDGLEFAQGFDVSLKDNDVLNNDVLFVQQTLRDVLGHRLSLSEEATQLTALQTANNRSDWVASLISDERVNTNRNAIIRLYNAILGRRSERSGLVFWIERYESGTNTLEDIANAFVGSGEFQSTYGTLSDGDFVNLVYQNVLGRAGDSGGVAYWTSQLDSSAISRGGLMIGFSESSENANLTLNRDRVVVLYTMLLARDPSDSEVDTWREDLNNGTNISILINQILADSEYQARFY